MPLFEILQKSPDSWRPLMGFMDERGAVLIEPQFMQNPSAMGNHFSAAGYAVVQRYNELKQIVINTSGETVFELPEDYKAVASNVPDNNGIFGVMHQIDKGNPDLWRMEGRDHVFTGETRFYGMRLDGTTAFEGYITASENDLYVVSTNWRSDSKKGLMDRHGTFIVPPIYDSIYLSRSSPYATVLLGKHTNVLRLNGTKVFSSDFGIDGLTALREVKNGLWVVPNKWKRRADVYDVATASVIGHLPMTFWSRMIPSACPTLSGGVACIQHPTKGSTFYYPDGRAAMAGILGRARWFDPELRVGYFNDDRASFKLGDLWGYMDLDGKHVIPPQFHSNLPFRDGLAKVRYPADGRSWDRFSYVDRDGAVVWHQEQ